MQRQKPQGEHTPLTASLPIQRHCKHEGRVQFPRDKKGDSGLIRLEMWKERGRQGSEASNWGMHRGNTQPYATNMLPIPRRANNR